MAKNYSLNELIKENDLMREMLSTIELIKDELIVILETYKSLCEKCCKINENNINKRKIITILLEKYNNLKNNQKSQTISERIETDFELIVDKEVEEVSEEWIDLKTINEKQELIENRVERRSGLTKNIIQNNQLPLNIPKITLITNNNQNNEYLCEWPECGQQFRNKSELDSHRLRHSKSKPYICDWVGCGYQSKSALHMRTHKNSHTGERPFQCLWAGCDKKYSTQTNLNRHIKSSHKSRPEVENYLCDYPECHYSSNEDIEEVSEEWIGLNIIDEKQQLIENRVEKSGQNVIQNNEIPEYLPKITLITNNQNNEYLCEWPECGQQFLNESELDSHRLTHSKSKPYICDWVGCGYQSKSALHMRTHKNSHTGERPFQCLWSGCDKNYSTQTNLNRHIKSSHKSREEIKKYLCDYPECNYASNDKFIIEQHKGYHKGDRLYKCNWPACDKSYSTKTNLNRHIYQCHSTKNKKFLCDYPDCHYSSNDKFMIEQHKGYHKGERPYKCDWPQCDKSYLSTTNLNRHINICHKQTAKKFSCDWPGCDYSSYNSFVIKLHKGNHRGERFYKCHWPACGKRFPSKTNLNQHIDIHNGFKRYSCDWPGCEFRSVYKYERYRHKRTHTGEKPFRCTWPSCEAVFAAKHHLNAHLMKHTGERPYSCEYNGCDRRFQSRQAMRFHYQKLHKQ